MGDMADELIDIILEAGDQYEMDYIDKLPQKCKGCGETNLRWKFIDGKKKLVDKKNKVHWCLWS